MLIQCVINTTRTSLPVSFERIALGGLSEELKNFSENFAADPTLKR